MSIIYEEARDAIRDYRVPYTLFGLVCAGAFVAAVSGVFGDAEATPPTTDSAPVEYSVPEHTGS